MEEKKLFKTGLSYGLALWANFKDNRVNYSIKKTYKDGEGKYKDTNVLFVEDLAALQVLIPRAVAWGDAAKDSKRSEQKGSEPPKTYEDDDVPF